MHGRNDTNNSYLLIARIYQPNNNKDKDNTENTDNLVLWMYQEFNDKNITTYCFKAKAMKTI